MVGKYCRYIVMIDVGVFWSKKKQGTEYLCIKINNISKKQIR